MGAGQVANARQSLRVAAGVQADPLHQPACRPCRETPPPISLIDAGACRGKLPGAACSRPEARPPEATGTPSDREREHAQCTSRWAQRRRKPNALASVPEAEPLRVISPTGNCSPTYCRALALKPLYRELIGKWCTLLKTGRSDCVVRLENDAAAVAWDSTDR